MTNEMMVMVKAMEIFPVVIDDHSGRAECITGLVEFNNSQKGLACVFDARHYSLNQCIISEGGVLHCTACSIGGVLHGAYPDAEELKEYNDMQTFDGGKIKCIHCPDGTKVYPAI